MKMYCVAIGERMPNWVDIAFQEYVKRLPPDYQVILKTLPAKKNLEKESEALLMACPKDTHRIALDRQGLSIDTRTFATSLREWHDHSQNIAFLIGGPEGISRTILQKTETIWSLSPLTLPHPLVRVVLAEQIYRAFSILTHHPYHR